jgi:hypothetical protein
MIWKLFGRRKKKGVEIPIREIEVVQPNLKIMEASKCRHCDKFDMETKEYIYCKDFGVIKKYRKRMV